MEPNRKNLRERADYGVRVARPGYDANNCAQNQLLFNSGWPILQIAEIIDENKMVEENVYIYKVTTEVVDLSTGTPISTTVETSYPDAPPAGWQSTYTYEFDYSMIGGEYRAVEVNRKYVRKPLATTRTAYRYADEQSTSGNILTAISKSCEQAPYIKKAHRLGYTPFFMTSDGLSDKSGYIILFSLDISKDVDYPYTERPLALLSPTTDYGIKSASKFGKRVPGLCSDMFSKLVQAVKTEETATGSGDKRSTWSPVKSASEAEDGGLLPFEFYSFISDSTTGMGIDGGAYYKRDYPYYLVRSSGDSLGNAWAVTVTTTQTAVETKNSLVVLRSPMVSPEYEERVL